jgi:hypothetical protein
VNVYDLTPEVRKQEGGHHHRWEDRSIFKYGLTYVQQSESLNRFIGEQNGKGNVFVFPEKEFQ